MKIVIVGYGSIAKKLQTAINAQYDDCKFVVFDLPNIEELQPYLDAERCDYGLVCSPTSLHVEHALCFARHSVPFFCEKPIFHPGQTLDRTKLSELLAISNHVYHMVACNMRFTDEIRALKQRASTVQKIKVCSGYNLAKWHNDGKHKELYSANKSMGGGITYDAIHEFDYLAYCFGIPTKADLVARRVGDVTVDTEDVLEGTLNFGDVRAEIHLDYLQNDYTRYYQVNDEPRVDFKITHQMYADEMRNFITTKQVTNTVGFAAELVHNISKWVRYE